MISLQSLQFDFSLPRYLFCKLAGRKFPSLYWHSTFSCLRYQKVPEPVLPNEEWVKVKVTYGGICGSDINLICLHDSPSISPFTSFPFTIGHESVGIVWEIGQEVKHLQKGDRVAVNPVLSCVTRGIPVSCSACERGDYSLCSRMTEGIIAPGLLIGACKDTGGSWSSYFVAHQSQIVKLPEEVSDLNGVMVEPFSCALHSILRNPPKHEDTILVIGSGTIGICIVAAIRALDISCKIVVLSKYDFQSRLAFQYGADEVISVSRDHQYIYEAAKVLGAKVLKPVFGPPVLQGGADLVIECAGNSRSINDALRFARRGGKVVLLGLAGILDRIDWTHVWLNELEVKGSFAYSREEFQTAVRLMESGKVDLSSMVTHRFPLDQYKTAFSMIVNKGRTACMKAVFEP